MPLNRWFAILLTALACRAEVKFTTFQKRDAWTLETAHLRVTILQSGGHIGEIVLKDAGSINPLWIQSRPTIDPEHYDPATHENFYGGGAGARLLSGLLGHNVCFPFWGNPSASEAKAGMTFHGETGVVRWRMGNASMDSLIVSAELPESQTRFTRTLQIKGQVVAFDETAENTSAWDRPIGWCEHVTLGPPFLERGATVIDASLTRGRSSNGSGSEFAWPEGLAETKIDLRKVRNLERSPGYVNHFLVDTSREYGYFTAFHPQQGLLFGYIFPRADFPWLNVWEANSPEMLTRGMEFSNTPVHGTLKALVKSSALFDTPVYEWLDAKSKLKKRFWAFSARVPADYRGVADVRWSGAKLEIVERETGKPLSILLE